MKAPLVCLVVAGSGLVLRLPACAVGVVDATKAGDTSAAGAVAVTDMDAKAG